MLAYKYTYLRVWFTGVGARLPFQLRTMKTGEVDRRTIKRAVPDLSTDLCASKLQKRVSSPGDLPPRERGLGPVISPLHTASYNGFRVVSSYLP